MTPPKKSQPQTLKDAGKIGPLPAQVDARPMTAPADMRAGQGQPAAPPQAPKPEGGIKVMATKTTYYDNKRRRPGDVFTIASEREFSDRYMEKVDPETPEKITTGAEVLRQQHDEILGAKMIEQNPGAAKPRTSSVIDEDE